MTDDILVLGATGTTGRRVAAHLRAAGSPVRGASRPGFDWTDRDTWRPTLADATALYLMAPDNQRIEPEFVDLAVGSGVRRIVLLSSRAVEEMENERLLSAERTVQGSGVDWTVLRPDWFDQNFDEGFLRPSVQAGEVAVPIGDVRQVFVDADDLAAVAATALVQDGHAGQTYEVTGPQALSFAEAVDIVATALGREIRFDGSAAAYRAALTSAGLPASQAESDLVVFGALAALGDQEPTDTVARITGRSPKTFTDYAKEVDWTTLTAQ